MSIFKAVVKYQGTHYSGWQIQKNQKTVQGEIQRALSVMGQSEMMRTKGSGRTDAGVHALGQVVRIDLSFDIEAQSLLKALNKRLPDDIRFNSIENCLEDFCPIRSASSKEYRYYFSMNEMLDPFLNQFVAKASNDINIERVKEILPLFLGQKDFMNYYCVGTSTKTTLRTIYSIELSEGIPPFFSNSKDTIYELKIVGSGFLKQMVRLIVGTIWAYGRSAITYSEIIDSFNLKQEKKLGIVAPAKGLFLYRVNYDD